MEVNEFRGIRNAEQAWNQQQRQHASAQASGVAVGAGFRSVDDPLGQLSELTCGEELCNQAHALVLRAEVLLTQSHNTLARVALPELPAPLTGIGPAQAPRRPFPPLFDQLSADLSSIETSLNKIAELLHRVSA